MFTALPGQEKLSAPRLMADDVGPCVFPAIQANDPEFGQIDRSPPMSERTRRMSFRKNLSKAWNSRLVPIRLLLKGNCGVKSAYFGVRGLWCTFQFLIKYLACGL